MYAVNVANEKIVRLQSGARGFRDAFFSFFGSYFNNSGSGILGHDGDIMSVLGTNGCFSLELYLKFMMVIATFNKTTLMGTHIGGVHKLDKLYDELNRLNIAFTADLETKYANSTHKCGHTKLKDFLASIGDQFVEWRYAYDKGKLNLNLNLLSDVLNYFENYSSEKFVSVSFFLVKSQVLVCDNQTMSIDSIDDIKKQ